MKNVSLLAIVFFFALLFVSPAKAQTCSGGNCVNSPSDCSLGNWNHDDNCSTGYCCQSSGGGGGQEGMACMSPGGQSGTCHNVGKCPSSQSYGTSSSTCSAAGFDYCCVANSDGGGGTADPCASGGTGTCETPTSSIGCPDSRSYLGSSQTCTNLGTPLKICCKTSTTGTADPCASGGTATCQTPVSGACPSGTGSTLTSATCTASGKVCCGTASSTTTTVKCDPAKFTEYAGVCLPTGTGLSKTPVADILLNLMKWMLYLFGFLAIIAFVISGIQYLSAAGNMNMIETAKRNMNYSIIGIIVALAGVVILVAIDGLLRGTGW